ncbi:MAG: type II secretion system protein [bacterium]|nr:type II secretion system protein [bacterium]
MKIAIGKIKNFRRGFTLIELVISIAIFLLVATVALFGYGKFRESITITNLSYDVALSIRQAQTYGLSVREFGGAFDAGYGVHFSKDRPNSFVLFADINGDKKFNDTGIGNSCEDSSECVSVFLIGGQNRINYFCAKVPFPDTSECSYNGGVLEAMDIVFTRPNTKANFTATRNAGGSQPNYESVDIHMASEGGKSRTVTIYKTGQISVGQ